MTHADDWPPDTAATANPLPANNRRRGIGETGRYLADDDLVTAVNTALIVEQPLLVTGEPGTGKTTLAWSIASELGSATCSSSTHDPIIRPAMCSSSSITCCGFYDAQTKNPDAIDPEHYVRIRRLALAIESGERRLVLIDESTRRSVTSPTICSTVIDQMQFVVPETTPDVLHQEEAVVVITSNSERELPTPSCGAASSIGSSFHRSAGSRRYWRSDWGDLFSAALAERRSPDSRRSGRCHTSKSCRRPASCSPGFARDA